MKKWCTEKGKFSHKNTHLKVLVWASAIFLQTAQYTLYCLLFEVIFFYSKLKKNAGISTYVSPPVLYVFMFNVHCIAIFENRFGMLVSAFVLTSHLNVLYFFLFKSTNDPHPFTEFDFFPVSRPSSPFSTSFSRFYFTFTVSPIDFQVFRIHELHATQLFPVIPLSMRFSFQVVYFLVST